MFAPSLQPKKLKKMTNLCEIFDNELDYKNNNQFNYPSCFNNQFNYPSCFNNQFNYPSCLNNQINYPSCFNNQFNYPSCLNNQFNYPSCLNNQINYSLCLKSNNLSYYNQSNYLPYNQTKCIYCYLKY